MGLLGPSLVASCKAISLTESGDWAQVYPAKQVQVRIVDFEASVCICLSALTGAAVDYVAFDPDDPTLFPLAVEVVAASLAWLRDRPGNRGAAGYVTAEELPADPLVGPALGKQAKARPAEKGKKPTLAGLAAQQTALQDLVVTLVDKVQALTDSQAAGAQAPRAQGPADLGSGTKVPAQVQAQAGRPILSAPLHQMLPPPPAKPKRLSDILGPPPPVRAPVQDVQGPLALELPGEEALPDIMQEELQQGSGEPLAQAMLLHTKALSSLVSQLSSGSGESLLDSNGGGSLSTRGTNGRLKIQAELALQEKKFSSTRLCRRPPAGWTPRASEAVLGRCRVLSPRAP